MTTVGTSAPNWQERYNAKFISTLRLSLVDAPGALARVLAAIADSGASVGDIRIIGANSTHKFRDVQVFATNEERLDAVKRAISDVEHVKLISTTDDVLEIHRGGAIETRSRVPLESTMDLRMVYTPGVARVCELIAENPDAAWTYTARGHRMAIVTDGSAVLGLGNIGPLASMPVMEGKSAILARFVGVSAEPILVESRSPADLIRVVESIASGYGAIQLEDIAAPDCFEIEEALDASLDIPVFHDDQHGTATVAIAGLIRALAATGRSPADVRAVVLGAGAAGLAMARAMRDFGIPDLLVCDSRGALAPGRDDLNPWKRRVAETTNAGDERGTIEEVLRGRNLFIGVSRPGIVTPDMVASMDRDAIVFALANPVSEIPVEDALSAGAAIAIDGRSMNNALAYPGIFRGALDARARRITAEMKLAAARALAELAPEGLLLPDMLDQRVHANVATAVAEAALRA